VNGKSGSCTLMGFSVSGFEHSAPATTVNYLVIFLNVSQC
jgi:hypothetical protein